MRRSSRRIRALIRKETLHILRDWRALLIVLGLPIIELFLFAYAVRLMVDHIPMAVVDFSLDSQSRAFLTALETSEYFDITAYLANEAQAIQAMDQGSVQAAVVIPPDFAARVERGEGEVLMLFDGSDLYAVNSGYAAATAIAQARSVKLLAQNAARLGAPAAGSLPLETSTRVLYNPDLKDMVFVLPALAAMLMQMLAIGMAAISVVREQELGTIEQILSTPIRPVELILGKIVPHVTIIIFDMLIVILSSIFWFGVPFRGNPWLFAWLSLLFILSGLGLGLLVSTIAKTQRQAQQIVSVLMLLCMLLTGIIYPRASMPWFAQFVGNLIPLTYFIRITRGIITKGVGLAFVWNDAVALGIYVVAVVALAASTFRTRLG